MTEPEDKKVGGSVHSVFTGPLVFCSGPAVTPVQGRLLWQKCAGISEVSPLLTNYRRRRSRFAQ
jgi:hypothetical protein